MPEVTDDLDADHLDADGLAPVPHTGDDRIDRAAAAVADVAAEAPEVQLEAFTALQAVLQDRLADVGE